MNTKLLMSSSAIYLGVLGIVFSLFISTKGHSQNENAKDIGIGMVFTLDAFDLLRKGIPSHLFYADHSFENTIDDLNLIRPYIYKPDYGLFHFICLEKHINYYKVLLNDSLSGYIKIDPQFEFFNWEDVLKKSLGIYRLNTTDHPMYTTPNTKSDTIKYNCNYDDFRPIDFKIVNGTYWVEFEYSESCKPDCDKLENKRTGWIIWRDHKRLFIGLLFLC